jgi:hypothetical protein
MMATPKAPRMAPTAMKTVPSGKVEWFMNGAFAVGGTVGGGNVPISVLSVLLSVGRPGKPPAGRCVFVDCVVGCPIGGRDAGVFVDRVVVRVFVFAELGGAGGGDGDVRWVPVLVVWVVPPVVVVPCAKASPERRETARTAERRSERFSEKCVYPIVTVECRLRRWGANV